MENNESPTLKLQIQLFGAFDVRIDGASIPPLRSRKVQWLLALLVLRHDRAVDRAWLAGTLWPESSHSQSLYNLRQGLSNLRSAFGETGLCLRPSLVNSLCLDLANVVADVPAFDTAIAAGSVDALERAVALYRGPLLEGCAEEWVFAERQSREESYLSALERLADKAFSEGNGSTAVNYLRSVIQVDPLREQAQRALIQAFAAIGDYGAAVQTYRELRLLLRRELNADPDPQTLSVFQQIRSETRRRTQVKPASSLPPYAAPPCRLPCSLTALVGRKSEIEQIVTTLRTARLLTLTGTGGVGKTRLAIAVGEEVREDYADGIFFVDLTPLSETALIPVGIAACLRLPEQAGRSTVETLTQYLAPKELLLILDNCEHLLKGCASLAYTLLQACPSLHILVTSRQPLGLSGEIVWRVPSLAFPSEEALTEQFRREIDLPTKLHQFDALSLFAERALESCPFFTIHSHNIAAIARICRRLDGIPLAIELAAARMRSLSIEEIPAALAACMFGASVRRSSIFPMHSASWRYLPVRWNCGSERHACWEPWLDNVKRWNLPKKPYWIPISKRRPQLPGAPWEGCLLTPLLRKGPQWRGKKPSPMR